VLGRFDGLNLDYRGFDRVSLNAVAGTPVYSASDDLDSSRVFLGASVGFSPVPDDLEMRVYYIQQDIEGIDDRQAVGTEFRYFGEKQSLWGLVDYDTSYATISSAFVQGSWRIAPQFSIHGSVDQRHTPFPGTRNALIGQPYADFSELLSVLSVEEIRQLSIDRTASTSTYSLGISHTLGPRLQLNADANHTTIGSTPESGGVAATAETNYRYYAASLTASSLVREGDVAIFGLRYSDSGATRSTSLSLDGRFPFGRYLRVNLRMRVDRREIVSDSSTEWQYLPGLRIEYRRSRKLRFELDIGKLFSQRDLAALSLDRESYFVNFGYQAFF
jgi:hypothetical protein